MRRPKIMIIDDEEHIRFLYADTLIEKGYDVITYGSGYELLVIIKNEAPDVVVLDIKMVDYNGLDLLQDIRNKYFDLPVILCTAYDTFMDDIKSISADYYVIKSFDLSELLHRISQSLDSSFFIEEKGIPSGEGNFLDLADLQTHIINQVNNDLFVIIENITNKTHETWIDERVNDIFCLLATWNKSKLISPKTILSILNDTYHIFCKEIISLSFFLVDFFPLDRFRWLSEETTNEAEKLPSPKQRIADELLLKAIIDDKYELVLLEKVKLLIININLLRQLKSSIEQNTGHNDIHHQQGP